MGNRAGLKIYDFTLTAGGSQVILANSDYFRIMSSTGAVDVTGDTFGTLSGLLTGQGLADTKYNRLMLKDASGASNSGTILCSGDLFIDNRTYGVNSLDAATLATLRQPLTPTGNFNSQALIAANTATQVFSAASNVNGAIVLAASCFDVFPANGVIALLAKATAPASVTDGDPVFMPPWSTQVGGTSSSPGGILPAPQYVAAGQGLWYISNLANTTAGFRTARYRLL